jgi:hypothetical protein
MYADGADFCQMVQMVQTTDGADFCHQTRDIEINVETYRYDHSFESSCKALSDGTITCSMAPF